MKKKCILLSLLLSIALLSSCSDDLHPCGGVPTDELTVIGESAVHTELEGFYITLNSVSESSVSVTWHNDTDLEIVFGEGYAVEMLDSDGKWVSVQKEEMSVPAIALVIPSGGTLDKGYSIEYFDLSKAGKYRLRSEFYHDGKSYSTWVEFSVTAETVEQINLIPDTDLSEFAKFLDREGFVGGMTQGQLLDLAEKYAEGLDPSIVPLFCHYDGEFGGGCRADGEFFGYTNDYSNKDGKVRYYNSFYAAVEIEALELPYGIKYGDSIEKVLEKLGIATHYSRGPETRHKLYADGAVSLTLVNYAISPDPIETLYHIELTYTEIQGTLTRTVKLSFSDGAPKKLARIDIKAEDNYEKE